MFSRTAKRYVVLQEYIPPREQRAIRRAVVRVWPRVRPGRAFVEQLNRDLVMEAQRQYGARHTRGDKTLSFLGLFSGGVLSVVGGLAIWLLVQKDHEKTGTDVALSSGPHTATPAISA